MNRFDASTSKYVSATVCNLTPQPTIKNVLGVAYYLVLARAEAKEMHDGHTLLFAALW